MIAITLLLFIQFISQTNATFCQRVFTNTTDKKTIFELSFRSDSLSCSNFYATNTEPFEEYNSDNLKKNHNITTFVEANTMFIYNVTTDIFRIRTVDPTLGSTHSLRFGGDDDKRGVDWFDSYLNDIEFIMDHDPVGTPEREVQMLGFNFRSVAKIGKMTIDTKHHSFKGNQFNTFFSNMPPLKYCFLMKFF